MAVYVDQPTRSPRFIKAYLAMWAVLALAALGYLGTLAFPSQTGLFRPQVAEPDSDPNQAMRALAKTAQEMGTLRRSLSDVQNDVAALKQASVERDVKDRAVASRLTAVEEQLTTLHTTVQPAEPAPASKPKISERHQRKPPAEARAAARSGNVVQDVQISAHVPAPVRSEDGPPVPLVTGSIEPKEEITFGEPVVTRAGPVAFAIQLAASPSLQGLRQSWSQLRDRHGSLAALEPRVVPPRSDGGPYRLLAGPFATRADADRICVEMGAGRNGCYVTTYIGTPL